MSDSLDDRHGTSDDYNDPWCDPCFDARGRNVGVYGYCKDCYQFLCTECHVTHSKLLVARGHVILKGADMPQSQSAKPPRFDFCDTHPKLLKDQFCSVHKSLLCVSCSSSNHNICPVKSVEDTCKNIQVSEIDALYDAVSGYKESLKSVISSVETNISKLKEERKMIMKEAQATYDQIIYKVNKLFGEMKKEMDAKYQSQLAVLSQHQKTINDGIVRVEISTTDIDDLKGKTIDTKIFLKIQEIVSNTMQYANDFKDQNQSLRALSLSFEPDENIRGFLTSSFNFGPVSVSEGSPGRTISVPDIIFPLSSLQQSPTIPRAINQQSSGQSQAGARSQLTKSAVPLSAIKATKRGTSSYNVKVKDDIAVCYITGIAITTDGRRLIVDMNNRKVKLFSQDMKFLSSVSVSYYPWDIAVLSDQEAVVDGNNLLVILDISGRQLRIKNTIKTPTRYNIYGISKYTDKLDVTCPENSPPCVKLIDTTGRVYWSVSSDQQGKPLFVNPYYVSSHDDGRSSSVIVSDCSNNTLTLLNGDTGEVITRRQVKGKGPHGIATDTAGNVYVCYSGTGEVAVLTEDLSEEKILLSGQDGLVANPRAIVCDDTAHQLLVSYDGTDSVVVFKLS